ncbi:MAG TPA: MG2 domain-containing protein, partial [Pyrinomonadaceae bacterium]|nr:MG2 domain-containing protein [Pyrinomonadaceae bacterium]
MRANLFPAVLVCLLMTIATLGQTVDESDSRVIFRDNTAVFDLVINQPSNPQTTNIQLEIIDPTGLVRAEKSELLTVKTGKHRYPVQIPVGELVKAEGDDVGWLRLRYTLGAATGVVSLTQLIKDVFELRLSSPNRVVPGSEYRMRVRAVNPFTKAGVKQVAVVAKLELELEVEDGDDELELTATASTDSDGLAILKFKVPAGRRLDDVPEFVITGRKNGFVREIDDDLDSYYYSDESPGLFTSDKPVYQPGETFNLRGMFLDVNNTVIAGKSFDLEIEDQEDTELASETIETSEFGIA